MPNYVANVRRLMPRQCVGEILVQVSVSMCNAFLADPYVQKRLDTNLDWYIIVFTYGSSQAYAQKARHRSQAPSPSRTGRFEPAPPGCHRRTVPLPRILRRPRSVAGQIRDAPPRRERRPFGDAGSIGVRILAAFVLSG